ncbi:MAG: hypothetical protein IT370_12830 [Deltaproteobacteria bacterium]|nr:hypothetical protein [Deltaproteobacteria bacterium]
MRGPLSFILSLGILATVGCGSKRSKRAASPGRDASLADAGAGVGGGVITPVAGPAPVGCTRVGLGSDALTAALGRTVRVLPAHDPPLWPPTCELDIANVSPPVTVMIDCSVRGGLGAGALAALREEGDYTALAELGSEALVSPGQVVFLDADSDCLITVSSAVLPAPDLMTLARLAERGVSPQSVW